MSLIQQNVFQSFLYFLSCLLSPYKQLCAYLHYVNLMLIVFSVAHLSAYLGIRDRIDMNQPPAQMTFTILTSSNPGHIVSLEHSLTLRQVLDTHWCKNSTLEIYYTMNKN